MDNLLKLISKFKTGSATESEKKELLNALFVNEAELKKWLESNYYQDIYAKLEIISQTRSEEIFNSIQQLKHINNIYPEQGKAKVISIKTKWLKWASVACVIGILSIVTWVFNINYKSSIPRTEKTRIQAQLKQKINNTSIPMITVLEDGTRVTIEPNSSISYYSPFTTNRDVSLSGKAIFKVAKDISRPFTVYASGVNTTALGTEFLIDAFSDNVKVKLLEGLVVIKTKVQANSLKSTYLKPGQQFDVNIKTGIYAVSSFKKLKSNNNLVANLNTITTKENEVSPILNFNKTPLSIVFTQIAKQYNKPIQFNNINFGTASFTGSFFPSDSLQTILTIICNTNDLSFIEKDGVFIISK